MKHSLLTILLMLLVNFTSCNSTGNNKGSINKTISVNDFDRKLTTTPNAQLLDVRTPQEFAGGHLKNAVNIDYSSDNFEDQLAQLDKSKPVLVYCLSGGRSSKAASRMQEIGFAEIYNLDGGIMKWNSSGKPLDQGSTAHATLTGTTAAEFNKMISSKKYVMVDFNAQWCEPCKKMMPVLESLAEKKKDILSLVRIDADENKELMTQKGIDAIPYLELYEDGKLIWKHSGYIDEHQILAETKL